MDVFLTYWYLDGIKNVHVVCVNELKVKYTVYSQMYALICVFSYLWPEPALFNLQSMKKSTLNLASGLSKRHDDSVWVLSG